MFLQLTSNCQFKSHATIPAMIIRRFRRRKLPPSLSQIASTEEAEVDLSRNDRNQNKKKSSSSSSSPSLRLHRTNAVRHIDYVLPEERCCSHSAMRSVKSLDIFRIDGDSEGMLASLCEHLELSSPDDLGISVEEWEEQKLRTKSDASPMSHGLDSVIDRSSSSSPACLLSSMISSDMLVDLPKREEQEREQQTPPSKSTTVSSVVMDLSDSDDSDGTKGGVSPKFFISPPVSISNLQQGDRIAGWEIVTSFDYQDKKNTGHLLTPSFDTEPSIIQFSDRSQLEGIQTEEDLLEFKQPEFSPPSLKINSPGSFMTFTSIDNDSSSSGTEQFSSPNKASIYNISACNKGEELGRGSYGTVFSAMTRFVIQILSFLFVELISKYD